MKSNDIRNKRVTIRLTTEERDRLEEYAAIRNISMSELLRLAINKLIKGDQN